MSTLPRSGGHEHEGGIAVKGLLGLVTAHGRVGLGESDQHHGDVVPAHPVAPRIVCALSIAIYTPGSWPLPPPLGDAGEHLRSQTFSCG